MDLITAIRSRRSTAPVTDAAPEDTELGEHLAVAAHSPDHAGLRPWRLISIRGTARQRLGQALVTGFGDEPGTPAAAKTASRPLRAPLLVAIVCAPVDHPKVPAWEQLAATAAMVSTLQLVLFDAGWTAMWRSGPAVELPEVRHLLGLTGREQLLGWLYIGGSTGTALDEDAGRDTAAGPSGGTRPDPAVGEKLSELSGTTDTVSK